MKWYIKNEEKLFNITMVIVAVALTLHIFAAVLFVISLK